MAATPGTQKTHLLPPPPLHCDAAHSCLMFPVQPYQCLQHGSHPRCTEKFHPPAPFQHDAAHSYLMFPVHPHQCLHHGSHPRYTKNSFFLLLLLFITVLYISSWCFLSTPISVCSMAATRGAKKSSLLLLFSMMLYSSTSTPLTVSTAWQPPGVYRKAPPSSPLNCDAVHLYLVFLVHPHQCLQHGSHPGCTVGQRQVQRSFSSRVLDVQLGTRLAQHKHQLIIVEGSQFQWSRCIVQSRPTTVVCGIQVHWARLLHRDVNWGEKKPQNNNSNYAQTWIFAI